MACPSLPPASPRKPTFLNCTTRSPGLAVAGNQSRRGWLRGLLPAPLPCWAAVCHQLPLVPAPVHGASLGVWLSPGPEPPPLIPCRATGADVFPSLRLPGPPSLLSSHLGRSSTLLQLTFFTLPHPLHLKWRSSLQERQTFRCISWREVGTQ